jgi:hypothetical protein
VKQVSSATHPRNSGRMRAHFFMLAVALCCASLSAADPRVSPRFRTVYVMPMTNSLDQHLASRLTSRHVLWVVLEPSSADAVLTDSLDETFWNWMARTYPAAAGAPGGNNNRGGAYRPTGAPIGRQRGTVFLVDPRRRLVLWSTYEFPRNSSPAELDRSATRISTQLKSAFGKN